MRERKKQATKSRRQNVYLNVFLIKCLLFWAQELFGKDKSEKVIANAGIETTTCLSVSVSVSLSILQLSPSLRADQFQSK